MSIIVQKYGGTSVGSVERIKGVAQRLADLAKEGASVVAVVSAMGDTTDELISLAGQISSSPNPREYDALVSNGENISAALVSMALNELGVSAISLTGSQAAVSTDGPHVRSKIAAINTDRIHSELKQGKVVIVTGFQGVNSVNDVATIGRGGSDTSAVVLAAALGVKRCDICTDVDGIYTTDPRVVSDAAKLSDISYDEMLELASLGAKVLHPRAVECAKENGIEIHVRSSFSPELGTIVKEAKNMEVQRPVTGATIKMDEAQVTISDLPDRPGIAGQLFSRLAEDSLNVDMITQTIGDSTNNAISFTVSTDDMEIALKVAQTLADEVGAKEVKCDNNVAKVSIVGVGMMSKPGVAAKLFQVLGENDINIGMISTSEIKVSCLVSEADAKRALQLLHAAFELESIGA